MWRRSFKSVTTDVRHASGADSPSTPFDKYIVVKRLRAAARRTHAA
jgi:hypothetical protein